MRGRGGRGKSEQDGRGWVEVGGRSKEEIGWVGWLNGRGKEEQ